MDTPQALRSAAGGMTRLIVGLAFVLLAAACGGDEQTTIAGPATDDTTAVPAGDGTWRELPAAPISTRAHAVSAWSGEEALFWAGSSLDRNLAHSDGAAYDPASDTWRQLPVPGWGHPGAIGTWFEGEFYVAAKGGGVRIDPSNGTDEDLPPVSGFVLAMLIAADDAVWGIGPEGWGDNAAGIGIARYEPEDGTWIPGPDFEGGPEFDSLFRDNSFVEQPVLWTGSEIVVWKPEGNGVGFDPGSKTWAELPALDPAEGTVIDSHIVTTAAGLAAMVELELDGDPVLALAVRDRDGWIWHDLPAAAAPGDLITAHGAGDWIVVVSPGQPPVTVHAASGTTVIHEDAPRVGAAPSLVWTGGELVIWGGIDTSGGAETIDGMVWTPPSDG